MRLSYLVWRRWLPMTTAKWPTRTWSRTLNITRLVTKWNLPTVMQGENYCTVNYIVLFNNQR